MCIGNHFNRIIVDTHMNIHENIVMEKICGSQFAFVVLFMAIQSWNLADLAVHF